MPGEEGYPAYLASRLAQFYERAGRVLSIGSEHREGTLSVIGAVSPAGGDISEPVTQATLRIVKVFWGLDSSLAYKRHFPAINWLTSYSLYANSMGEWFNSNISSEWTKLRGDFIKLLSEEAELQETVKLVGMDAISDTDRLKMEAARSIREDFLHQAAFHEVDTYASAHKQYTMMKAVWSFYEKSLEALKKGADIEKISLMDVREKIGRLKYVKEDEVQTEYDVIISELEKQLNEAMKGEDDDA